jgi:ABC-2 type transport system ATP-binding protein
MSVVVKSLTKVYDTQTAVNAISFTAEKGSILGFLGPNGAGKSTTMKMLTGYLPPTSGGATVAGLDIVTQSLEVRRKIGYLPESNPLYQDMYVKEYLGFIAGIYQIGKVTNAIARVIEQVGLGPEQHKKIHQLSKGYKQRVGLAQALIHEPEVLILDEPTSGLDPIQLQDIRELIRQLGKEKTIIFSTHIMQEVQAICQRVIIINKGVLIANDTTEALQQKISGEAEIEFQLENSLSLEKLMACKAVNKVVSVSNNHWKIYSSDSLLTRKSIFQLAVDEHNTILKMTENKADLESVFQQLTQKASAHV